MPVREFYKADLTILKAKQDHIWNCLFNNSIVKYHDLLKIMDHQHMPSPDPRRADSAFQHDCEIKAYRKRGTTRISCLIKQSMKKKRKIEKQINK